MNSTWHSHLSIDATIALSSYSSGQHWLTSDYSCPWEHRGPLEHAGLLLLTLLSAHSYALCWSLGSLRVHSLKFFGLSSLYKLLRRQAGNRVRRMPLRCAPCKIPSKSDIQGRWEEQWLEETSVGQACLTQTKLGTALQGCSQHGRHRLHHQGRSQHSRHRLHHQGRSQHSRHRLHHGQLVPIHRELVSPSAPLVTLRSALSASCPMPFAIPRIKGAWILTPSLVPHQSLSQNFPSHWGARRRQQL